MELTETQSLKKKIIKSGFWASSSFAVSKIFQITASIVIARILSPNDYGINGVIWAFLMLMEQFTQMGLQPAIVQNEQFTGPKMDSALDTLFTVNVIRGTILCMLLFISASMISNFYKSPEICPLIRVISLYFFLRGFVNVGLTINIKNVDFKKIEIWEQASISLGFVITIILAVIYKNVWALVYGAVIGAAIYTLTTYFITPYKPKLRINREIFLELFSFGKYFFIIQLLIIFTSKIDSIVIGKVVGLTELGYYVLAYRIVGLNLIQITKVIYKVTFPAIASIQGNVKIVVKVFKKSLKYYLSLVLPLLLFLFFYSDKIIEIVYGKKWLPIVPVFNIMILFSIFKSTESLFKSIFEATGNIKLLYKIHLSSALIFLILIYPVTIFFQIIGVAFLALFVTLFFHLMSWPAFFLRFNVSIKSLIQELTIPLISTMMMFLFMLSMDFNSLVSYKFIPLEISIKFIMSFTVYGAVYYALLKRKRFKEAF